jgi:hypothetical protein
MESTDAENAKNVVEADTHVPVVIVPAVVKDVVIVEHDETQIVEPTPTTTVAVDPVAVPARGPLANPAVGSVVTSAVSPTGGTAQIPAPE